MSFCLDVLLSLVETVGSEDIRTTRQKDKMLFGGKRNFYSQKGAAMADKTAGQICREVSKKLAAQRSAIQQSVIDTFGIEPTNAVSPPEMSPGEIAICARLDTIIDCMAQQTTTLEAAPPEKREYGYWPKAVNDLMQILKNSGGMDDFICHAGSPSSMLDLLRVNGFATMAERDDRSTQRAVGNVLKKYEGLVNEYAILSQDGYRASVEQLDDIANGAGLTDARRKSVKPHDYTPKFKERKKK